MEECLEDADNFFVAEEGPGPRNYVRPEAIYVRKISMVCEAVELPNGEMTMRHHHFDVRELPIVALNPERNFFLTKCRDDRGRNELSTDLDWILKNDLIHNYLAHQ